MMKDLRDIVLVILLFVMPLYGCTYLMNSNKEVEFIKTDTGWIKKKDQKFVIMVFYTGTLKDLT
jgi:hypothetical protein